MHPCFIVRHYQLTVCQRWRIQGLCFGEETAEIEKRRIPRTKPIVWEGGGRAVCVFGSERADLWPLG